MSAPKVEGRLSQTDVKCASDRYCNCSFELWSGESIIASCPTLQAHDAARRLLSPQVKP